MDSNQRKISVNIAARSGTYHGPGAWIFSRMTTELEERLAADSRFEVVVTNEVDHSRHYDVYHYLHSTIAQEEPHNLHRAVVMVAAMDDLEDHRTFAAKRKVFQSASRVSSMSILTLAEIAGRGIPASKLRYTPLGVPLDKFVPDPRDRKEIYAKEIVGSPMAANAPATHFTPETIRIGVVGRRYDDGRKGEQFLMDGIRLLSTRIPQEMTICLSFVGPRWEAMGGIDLGDLPNVVVEFHPDLPFDMYPTVYNTLDAVVVTSKTEGGPMCIMEALACGTRVISTPGGHANEFLTRLNSDGDEELGNIVGYGDIPGLARTLKEWVCDNINETRLPTTRTRVSRVMRETDNISYRKPGGEGHDPFAPYDWAHFVQNYTEIYLEIAAEMGDGVHVADYISEANQDAFRQSYRLGAKDVLSNIYVENFLHVMPYATSGVGISSFANLLKGIPTVIVGLGPSLDDNIDLLREHQDDVAIIVCDAGLKKLMREGITPHFAIVGDPTDKQVENLTGVDGTKFITLMPTIVHPMVFHASRKSDCVTVWYNVADGSQHICKQIPRIVGSKGALEPAVLTTGMAYLASLLMGSWPTTFVGMDLCWYDFEKGYASGTSPTKVEWQRRNKMFNNPVMLFPDLEGKVVVTEPCFLSFWQWMNDYLGQNDLYVYNSSGRGILHGDRIRQAPLRKWLAQQPIGRAAGLRDGLMHTYQESRQTTDLLAGHQFMPEEMEAIREEMAGE